MLRSQRGQSVAELALLLPVLLSILIGIVDLGRAFNAYITITNAAREGARYGSIHPNNISGIKAQAVAVASGSGLEITSDNVTIASCSGAGNPCRVRVEYDFPLLTGFLDLRGDGMIHLTSEAEMVILGE